jgi:hypothetical protein
MSGGKKARRTPRKKAVRTRKAKGTITYRLTVEWQEMIVEFKPDGATTGFPMGQFTFRSPHEPPRRIPVSETGYRTHFAPMEEINSYKSPKAYAKAYVLSILDQVRARKPGSRDQLSLF